MKKGTKAVLRVIISIIYIIWGISSPLTAIGAILSLNPGAIASAAVGVLMLLAGLLGLIGIRRGACRVFGVIILVASIVAIALALPALSWQSLVTALLAWLFIVCL